MARRRWRAWLKSAVVLLALAAVSVALWRWLSPTSRWARARTLDLRVLIVDYTVPFADYKEHRGLIWLLNHRKVRAPGLAENWRAAVDYVGYRPDDREHPVRLAAVDTRGFDVVYVADTYGVYRDDLRDVDKRSAHMDYTPLVFGALSDGDAHALAAFAERGGTIIAEFNSFAEPTSPVVRRQVEPLLGVEWSGWVGRVFVDPYDPSDVPAWLPREFARQFPGQELPHSPILLLADRDGILRVFSAPSLIDVAPRVVMTDLGWQRYPDARADAPYYYWFSLVVPGPGTQVFAELRMPAIAGIPELLDTIGVPRSPPAMTEMGPAAGRRIYLACDCADIDFDPGEYASAGMIARSAALLPAHAGPNSTPVFWKFYAPMMHKLLDDLERAHRGRP
jgi:hypothetical protein